MSKPTGALNRVVAQNSDNETGGMQANRDVVNENDLRLEYLESILVMKTCFLNIKKNKECCKQCRYVMFKGTMTKWPVQKLAQGTTQKLLQHHDATDSSIFKEGYKCYGQ